MSTDTDLTHTPPAAISTLPHTVLGHRADGRPILPIAGGAESNESDEPDVEVDDTPDAAAEAETEAGGEPEQQEEVSADPPKPKPPAKQAETKPDEFKPPSETEWRKTQAALKKANDEGKKHRLRNKELEDAARTGETEHEKALREAREAGETRYRTPLVKTAIRGALVEAGALAFLAEEKDPESQPAREKGESRLSRLLKLVDLEGLDIDDDGGVSGLETAISELTRDYPELFTAPARKAKVRPTGAPRPAAQEKPKSTAEQHAARLLGRS